MKTPLFLFLVCLLGPALPSRSAELHEVATFPDQQVTGVGVSVKSGRIFVNFPYWSDDHRLSVAEIVGGQPKPFPDEAWNKKDGDPTSRFVCVQSVVVDDQDQLWVLDPAAPKMEKIVKDGPKLVKVDLATNKVIQTIPFSEDVASEKSYLNDVRIDTAAGKAFITESGKGAIIVVDLKSGKARRLLDGHKSVQAEKGFDLVVQGKPVRPQGSDTPPQIASDGIALDLKNGYLYYHALTGKTLYRIKTSDLTNEKVSSSELEGKVETVAETPAPDGMLEGPNGVVYLTNLEKGALEKWTPGRKQLETVIADPRLLWPDTLSWGPRGEIYVTTAQIHHMPRFNNGKSTRTEPYRLWKVTGVR